MRETHNYWPVGLALAVIALFAVGGAYSYAYFADTEAAAVSIQASDDFTKDAGVAIVRPGQIPNVSTDASIQVFLNVTDQELVDETHFSIRLADDRPGDGVAAERAGCAENHVESWDCRVRFSRQALLGLVDREPGTYEVIVRGWWEDDRDFEAAGELNVMEAGSRSSSAGTESGRASGTGSTTANTTTAPSTSATSPTSTATSTPTVAPTPTETPADTPTVTNTPTPDPTQSTTETGTGTASPTQTPSSTPTETPTPTPTHSTTPTATPIPTDTPTDTPTATTTQAPTPTPTPTESVNQVFRWLGLQYDIL